MALRLTVCLYLMVTILGEVIVLDTKNSVQVCGCWWLCLTCGFQLTKCFKGNFPRDDKASPSTLKSSLVHVTILAQAAYFMTSSGM